MIERGTVTMKTSEKVGTKTLWHTVALLGTGGVLAAYLGVGWLYVLSPSVYDHVEATLLVQGLALVEPGYDEHLPYLQYGPATYLIQGLTQRLWADPILAGKVAGALGPLAGLMILMLSLRTRGLTVALVASAYCAALWMMYGYASYAVRPDSLLILSACLCAAAIIRPTPWTISGALLGAAMAPAAKVHGLVYLAPLVALFLSRHGWNRTLMLAVAATIGTTGIAFLYPEFSSADHLRYLGMAGQHALSREYFATNLRHTVLITFPGLLLIARDGGLRRKGCLRSVLMSHAGAFPMYVLSVLAVTVVASKTGAGPHHLMPLAPVTVGFVIGWMDNPVSPGFLPMRSRVRAAGVVLAIGWMGLVAYKAVPQQKALVDFCRSDSGREEREELQQLADRHSKGTLIMGYSDNASFPLAFHRVLIFDRSLAVFPDPITIMDHLEAGISQETPLIRELDRLSPDVVILPGHGEPFVMHSSYPSRLPVFGEAFQEYFTTRYQRLESGTYYSVWKRIP